MRRAGARGLGCRDVVGGEQRARAQVPVSPLKTGDVPVRTQVDQHKIERLNKCGNTFKRVANLELDVVRKPGFTHALAREIGLIGSPFESHHLAAGCAPPPRATPSSTHRKCRLPECTDCSRL